jgi:hypothetical protein
MCAFHIYDFIVYWTSKCIHFIVMVASLMSVPNLNDHGLLSHNLPALDGPTGIPLGSSAGFRVHQNSQAFSLWQSENAMREESLPTNRSSRMKYKFGNDINFFYMKRNRLPVWNSLTLEVMFSIQMANHTVLYWIIPNLIVWCEKLILNWLSSTWISLLPWNKGMTDKIHFTDAVDLVYRSILSTVLNFPYIYLCYLQGHSYRGGGGGAYWIGHPPWHRPSGGQNEKNLN